MKRPDVQAWLDRYVAAWRSHDPQEIGELFTEDAVYRYRPYGAEEAVATGRAAIIQAWLDQRDPPGSWEAAYRPYAVEGDRAVAVGTSRYVANDEEPEKRYHNVFLLRFTTDGDCAEFTEYYMLEDR